MPSAIWALARPGGDQAPTRQRHAPPATTDSRASSLEASPNRFPSSDGVPRASLTRHQTGVTTLHDKQETSRYGRLASAEGDPPSTSRRQRRFASEPSL